jgi:drug/metabolite transporter (DMT)-like permease
MWLILLAYFLMAATFTLAKTAVIYMKPIFFIAIRMIIAGSLLLAYFAWKEGKKVTIAKADLKLFIQLTLFHIYCAYILEFWALQYISSSKASLLYSLSPFITALLSYYLLGQILSRQKWFALTLGFLAMIPVLLTHASGTTFHFRTDFFSFAELTLIFAIGSAAYGWLLMKQLITRGYSTIVINGVSMFAGGIACLATAVLIERSNPLISVTAPPDVVGSWLMPYLGSYVTGVVMSVGCMASLIILANFIGYNLYGYLLRHYSATFLSFAGFITPFFTIILGWFFLSEQLTLPFLVSFVLTIFSLYLFYRQELTQ